MSYKEAVVRAEQFVSKLCSDHQLHELDTAYHGSVRQLMVEVWVNGFITGRKEASQ